MKPPRMLAVGLLVACGLATATPATAAEPEVPVLRWASCGEAPRVECATASVPRDYDRPAGAQYRLAVARVPARDTANRIGSLFFNPGGPGASAVGSLQAQGAEGLWRALNERFDIVTFDPRGVGQSAPAIDCGVNQMALGVYAMPFATPPTVDPAALAARAERYIDRCLALNGSLLAHVSTANVARDLDLLRAAVGDAKLTYLGFSYGTVLGATYASMFPTSFRALTLDGPVDADAYINRPMANLAAQTQGLERALGRFLAACKSDQAACSRFGGADPWLRFDELLERADAEPIPAPRYGPDPRPVTGDDLRMVASTLIYQKPLWGVLAYALVQAQAGDASFARALVDESWYGRDPETGTFSPFLDRYFTIGAAEQSYSREPARYLEAGERAYDEAEHFYYNHGYVELNYGLYPIRDRDRFTGPFRVRPGGPTPLVVATRYDPATPYRGAQALVRDLGNARLLTMRGDGHTAYGDNSPCVNVAVEAYLERLALPAPGARCTQEVPFEAFRPVPGGLESRVARTPVFPIVRVAGPLATWPR
jgi:pimeloyl-ACP methyl ester carboxylesterase